MSTKTNSLTNKSMQIKRYAAFLEQLKRPVQEAQIKAAISVNTELIKLYWDIGKAIVEKQEMEGWVLKLLQSYAKIYKMNFVESRDLLTQMYLI